MLTQLLVSAVGVNKHVGKEETDERQRMMKESKYGCDFIVMRSTAVTAS